MRTILLLFLLSCTKTIQVQQPRPEINDSVLDECMDLEEVPPPLPLPKVIGFPTSTQIFVTKSDIQSITDAISDYLARVYSHQQRFNKCVHDLTDFIRSNYVNP